MNKKICAKISEKYLSLAIPVKAALWFTICNFLQKGISVITTPIWTRLFTPNDFGIYNIFISWKSVLSVFITFNLAAGVFTRGLLKYEEKQDSFVSSMQGLLSINVILYFLVYISFYKYWNSLLDLKFSLILCMFIMMWSETIFAFWAVRQQFNYKYKKVVIITLLMSLLTPTFGILGTLMFPEQKVECRIISMTVIEFFLYTPFFVKQIIRSKHIVSMFFWKYAIRFNLPLLPHYLSQTILNCCDRIMIGKMIGEREAGLYSLAYNVAMLLTLVNTAIHQVINPWLFRKIKEKSFLGIEKVGYSLVLMVAIFNLIFIIFAPEVIRIFAPIEYYEAIWIMPPIIMSVFFMFMYGLFADFEFYYEKTVFVAIASFIGALLNVILNGLFIPIYGYIAAGYTTLFCYIIYVVMHYCAMVFIVKRNEKNTKIYNPLILFTISLIFMLSGFFVMLLYEHVIIKYIFLFVILLVLCAFRKKLKVMIYQIIKIQQDK